MEVEVTVVVAAVGHSLVLVVLSVIRDMQFVA